MPRQNEETSAVEASNNPSARWSLDDSRWINSDPGYDAPVGNGSGNQCSLAQEQNPFIRFKNLVDGTFTTISNIGKSRREAAEATRQSEQDLRSRWTGQRENHQFHHNAIPRSYAVAATGALLRVAEEMTLDVSPRKIDALFSENEVDIPHEDLFANAMLAFGGACYFLPEIGDRLPSSASLFREPRPPPRWLSIQWFKESPYSPVQVETIDALENEGGRWRAAFEDLINVSLDRPMYLSQQQLPLRPTDSSRLQTPESGVDWVLGLQYRGVLPPLLPNVRFISHRPTPNNAYVDGIGVLGTPNNDQAYGDFNQLVDEIWWSGRAAKILSVCEYRLRQRHGFLVPGGTATWNIQTTVGKYDSENGTGSCTYDATASTCVAAENLEDSEPSPQADVPNKSRPAVRSTVQTTHTTRTANGIITIRTTAKRLLQDGTEEDYESFRTAGDGLDPSRR